MRFWLWIIAFVGGSIGILAVLLGSAPSQSVPLPPRVGPPLHQARTWGYQLQRVQPSRVPADIDMLVVDYSRDGTEGRALRADEVSALQLRPDGSRRIVLSYLSIGEAENYRYYWKPWWRASPPAWLGRENPNWKGNFPVRYWDRDWQALIFQASDTVDGSFWARIWRAISPPARPYLDRILEAGFDGVYLDRIDAFDQPLDQRRDARADMVAFVGAISRHAKARRSGFLVLAQNAEQLLPNAEYRRSIDGVAKEDLYYGEGGDGVANTPIDTRQSIALLNRAKADGKPVFTIEYLSDPKQQREVAAQWRQLGFVGVFADRGLTQPPVVPPMP